MTVTQGSKAMLSTVEFLLNTDDYVSRSGISISEQGRLNLLGTLADAMSRLHALGIVIGDVSPKNLLFNLSSYVSCFFIDCDAIRLHGECALEQIDTPEWEVPPGEEKGTEGSDSYKFGLLAIRLFARDQSSRDGAALSALSAELGALAGRSQDRDPAGRPAPGSWVSAIQSAASAASCAKRDPDKPAAAELALHRWWPAVPAVPDTPAAKPVRSGDTAPGSVAPSARKERPGPVPFWSGPHRAGSRHYCG